MQITTGLPPIDGGSAILDGPTLDQDLQGLKRKLEQEEEVKRTRQKTGSFIFFIPNPYRSRTYIFATPETADSVLVSPSTKPSLFE